VDEAKTSVEEAKTTVKEAKTSVEEAKTTEEAMQDTRIPYARYAEQERKIQRLEATVEFLSTKYEDLLQRVQLMETGNNLAKFAVMDLAYNVQHATDLGQDVLSTGPSTTQETLHTPSSAQDHANSIPTQPISETPTAHPIQKTIYKP
jgi:hypothetical protein